MLSATLLLYVLALICFAVAAVGWPGGRWSGSGWAGLALVALAKILTLLPVG